MTDSANFLNPPDEQSNVADPAEDADPARDAEPAKDVAADPAEDEATVTAIDTNLWRQEFTQESFMQHYIM